MGVNSLQISCMLICKNETNLVNVIFTMTLLITLRVRKSVFSSRVYFINYSRFTIYSNIQPIHAVLWLKLVTNVV